jgi:hypothetical protein
VTGTLTRTGWTSRCKAEVWLRSTESGSPPTRAPRPACASPSAPQLNPANREPDPDLTGDGGCLPDSQRCASRRSPERSPSIASRRSTREPAGPTAGQRVRPPGQLTAKSSAWLLPHAQLLGLTWHIHNPGGRSRKISPAALRRVVTAYTW